MQMQRAIHIKWYFNIMIIIFIILRILWARSESLCVFVFVSYGLCASNMLCCAQCAVLISCSYCMHVECAFRIEQFNY